MSGADVPLPEEPNMDIHKPKPWHNWREFLKELGTIALGVGIALAAEQTVEYFHWRAQVRDAREVIASEMARNISFAISRMRMQPCMERRLARLDRILDDAADRERLPPLGGVGLSIQSPWSNGAWESVVASQTATHFSREEMARLSLVYRRVERIEAWNREESEAWTLILSMDGPGRRLNDSYETELRKAIRLAAYLNGVISIGGARMIQGAMDENLPFAPEERRQMAEAMKARIPDNACEEVSSQPGPMAMYGAMGATNLAELDRIAKQLPALVAQPRP